MLSALLAFLGSVIMCGVGLAACGVALMFFADVWSCLSAHKEASYQTAMHFKRKNALARKAEIEAETKTT